MTLYRALREKLVVGLILTTVDLESGIGLVVMTTCLPTIVTTRKIIRRSLTTATVALVIGGSTTLPHDFWQEQLRSQRPNF